MVLTLGIHFVFEKFADLKSIEVYDVPISSEFLKQFIWIQVSPFSKYFCRSPIFSIPFLKFKIKAEWPFCAENDPIYAEKVPKSAHFIGISKTFGSNSGQSIFSYDKRNPFVGPV